MDNLLNYSLEENPLKAFLHWYEAAKKVEQNAEAMSVSTYDSEKKRPSSRYILFKGIKDQKLVFYTNYISPKSKELDNNPEIALAFYWHITKKQVRIHGKVTKMSKEDSASYFKSRDRDSQIASYLSSQSSEIEDKASLLLKFKQVDEQFLGQEIPLPAHWGGYLVEPYEYEFFLYGDHRLNDRFLYEYQKPNWKITRLQP